MTTPLRRIYVPSVRRWRFGSTPGGTAVEAFDITAGECQLTVLTLGAIITSWRTATGDELVLGLPSVNEYLTRSPYFGAVVGRYANRIARARCVIDGSEVTLRANDGEHQLHGGTRGFDKRVWTGRPVKTSEGVGVALSLVSADGDEGFPGTLRATVRYLLSRSNQLFIDYTATTTRTTIVNLSQHTYFNLGGPTCPDVLDHELQVHADTFTPVDATLIPTGVLQAVADSAFDLRVPVRLRERVVPPPRALEPTGGYDHNFVIRRSGPGLVQAARLTHPPSGRSLDVSTTEPGLQVYSANFLDGTLVDSTGRALGRHAGICLETQRFPDTPNQPSFPSALLRRGQMYRSRTIYALSLGAA